MKVLVTGTAGQLGHDVVRELRLRDVECYGADKADFDLTDKEAVLRYIRRLRPDTVIHCAAYTAVDRAEEEPDICENINRFGTENVAKACSDVGAEIIYVSTDYCFDGKKPTPYEVDDEPAPLSVYGRTKLLGELAAAGCTDRHYIVRTSWVFGANGGNFVKTMLRLGKERDEICVVNDQTGSPTYTKDLAKLLCSMAGSGKYGVYHATNEGFLTWADFARLIMKKAGLKASIRNISSAEYPSKAVRPLNSRLSKASLTEHGFDLLPDCGDALDRFLAEIGETGEK